MAFQDKQSIGQGSSTASHHGEVRGTFRAQPARRIFDLVVATMSLILLAPILLLTTIAIKIESRGPILTREVLHGYRNRAIDVRKFRTTSVYAWRERPTRVGQILRQSGIDELPLLLNVVRGEMSITDLLRAARRDGVFRP